MHQQTKLKPIPIHHLTFIGYVPYDFGGLVIAGLRKTFGIELFMSKHVGNFVSISAEVDSARMLKLARVYAGAAWMKVGERRVLGN